MKKINTTIFLLALSSILYSEQWQIMGTRAMGMGGAYVAMAKGPIAQYWNPAGLLQISTNNFNGIEVNAGAGIEATGGILNHVTEITNLSKEIDAIKNSQSGSEKIDANQMSAFVKTLGILNEISKKDDIGALVEANGGVGIKISKLSISLNNFTSVSLNPFIDVERINIVSNNAGDNLPIDTSTTNWTQSLIDERDDLKNIILQLAGKSNGDENLTGTNFEGLLCGDSSCLSSKNIDTAENLATALINQAINYGASEEDIRNFIDKAEEYVPQASQLIAGVKGSFSDNQSNLDIKARSFTELALGYAWDMSKYLNGLSIGANLKLIRADIARKTFYFIGESETKDAFKDILDNKKASTKPAIDLGFLWNIRDKYPRFPFKPRVGLTIRNINSPEFDDYGSKYKLDPQARMGIALSPFNWWHFSMDIDLTKNSTPVDGFKSRQLAFGTEINIINRKSFNLPLRLGVLKNLAETDSKTVYTAGIGLTFAYLHIEAAAGISTGKTKIDKDTYPQKACGVVNVGILF